MKITKNNFEKNIFKSGSKTYFTSSVFFPKDKRLAVYKLYSFVRLADDFVDEIPQNKTAFLLLKNSYQKKASNVPIVSIKKVLQNIYDLQKEYKISNVEIKAFLCSMEMDLKKQKQWDPNWDDKWCTEKDLESPDDEVVCTCWDITKGDIRKKAEDGMDFKQIQSKTGLGLSCGLCINRSEYLVNWYLKNKKK